MFRRKNTCPYLTKPVRRGLFSYRVYPEGQRHKRQKTDSYLQAHWWAWYLGMREIWYVIKGKGTYLPRRITIETRYYGRDNPWSS